MSPPARPNPAGALCYILDDEARTRRLCLLLAAVAFLGIYPPVAGVLALLWAWQGRRRG